MAKNQMLINYVPGEECRVAIVEDGKLEELYAERSATASRVGNIYVGRVNNVEASIQAAFVDFGVGENGFLHVSDLHPRYFPGETDDTTEAVGHKTPRRERPPMQHALRRGDEVIVQVLKEGVGTKGPTLTSYLSIPGRFLVMMPQMDKVGVSRKVEDEEIRRKMREILDQLELPEGFGFILRTAGMDRTKAELKRDLAYLMRLWKDMERRKSGAGRTRLLYSESDLLVRCLRDLLTTEIEEVVIDNEQALIRAERFMKIVAPRTSTKLLHYTGKTPIFHMFGIEQQIALIHAREVPLPSGGRLVIDQTEALVAIDVNSGKARDARDAEDNAYKTNIEAVDEICRQLRLRDLGGIVVNDLIDMRHASHRKDIENRFRERLKRDRAKSTIAPISPFGILEMTRQRMRGSHEQVHFSDCPTCRGRGLVQRPDSVAADGLRELAAILDLERVAKVEMVVGPRVAGELLSNRRRLLGRIERLSGKHVDVRVSEDIRPDMVSFYGYDATGADVDVTKLPISRRPSQLQEWTFQAGEGESEDPSAWAADPLAELQSAQQSETEEENQAEARARAEEAPPHPIEIDEAGDEEPISADALTGEGGKRRRRRRRGRGTRGRSEVGGAELASDRGGGAGPADPTAAAAETREPQPAMDSTVGDGPQSEAADGSPPMGGETGEGGRRRRRRRRRGRGGRGGAGPDGHAPQPGDASDNGALSRVRPDRRDPHYVHASDQPLPEVAPVEGGVPDIGGSGQDRGGDDAPNGAIAAEGQPTEGQQGDGQVGRRRRRRRRGRGGRGGGEGRGAPHSGGQISNQPGIQSGNGPGGGFGGAHRADPGGAGGESGGAGHKPAAPAPEPKPPAPRTLYFSRRKLNPSELNRRPKPE